MDNYILESMDVTDVSIDDIEYEKQLAEINVIEALVECYEKQLVLLEYNEESACEIMMEYGIIMESDDPYNDKRPFKTKAKAAFNRMLSALKTLVLSIIDQIRAANFSKLGKMINNMEGAGIEIKVSSAEFKNKDSVFFIINGKSMNDKWSKIGDYFDFLQDNWINASTVGARESIKKEFIDKCDELIKVSNHLFDDGKGVDSDVKIFDRDQLTDMCLICSGYNMKALRSFAHQIEKWNAEYSRFGHDTFDSNFMSKLREAVKALIKALTRYSKALIPIVKVIRNIIKNKDPNKFKEYDIENNETTKPNTTDEKVDSTESKTSDESKSASTEHSEEKKNPNKKPEEFDDKKFMEDLGKEYTDSDSESKTSDESKTPKESKDILDELKSLTNKSKYILEELMEDVNEHDVEGIRRDILFLADRAKDLSVFGKVIDKSLEYAFSHGIKENELYTQMVSGGIASDMISVKPENWTLQYLNELTTLLNAFFSREYIAHVKKVAKYLSENK